MRTVNVLKFNYYFARGSGCEDQMFVHVAYVRGSVLLRHVDDRPHRLSAGRGDGSAQRGRSVIYDCLVMAALWNRAGHYIFAP